MRYTSVNVRAYSRVLGVRWGGISIFRLNNDQLFIISVGESSASSNTKVFTIFRDLPHIYVSARAVFKNGCLSCISVLFRRDIRRVDLPHSCGENVVSRRSSAFTLGRQRVLFRTSNTYSGFTTGTFEGSYGGRGGGGRKDSVSRINSFLWCYAGVLVSRRRGGG